MRFASLGSGSKGNATLVQAGDTLLMVDCGFSVRETTRRLARLGLVPDDLSAILVTHEHSDHCAGVAKLSRKFDIPVYLSHGTAGSGRCDGAYELRCFNSEDCFALGDISVQTVRVPHDAAEPCQYRFDAAGLSLGILTDLGCITPHVVEAYRHCGALVLEFNHDQDMLQAGQYPPQLKRRVGGDWGHLNNMQAADLLGHLAPASLSHLVIAHISEQNNARPLAEAALQPVGECARNIIWACQADGFGWLEV
ncbi:MBL fold metallo-hydrolase [Halioglobus japonicus]|uniref:MBL fold metallo-hydrolase n=1 Tax=Halioglobus japonicus TaxID=930805 RepID=A0AAP8MG12_9GAMM|nr:MBL fold metallo-hydrolase [Halioglobus japonicus]AQA19829.1 MBL fold metallo-hydrolase [Halioglobus japonicus]PLW87095.1 MBL fold metallo-hydrolase [Halioglobus japonicus]GHD10216.1 MBL fold metallo-hydrolase [Halioglobus japonicus]